jgi:WhiB family redox-sensing transcriptional regulator
LSPIFPLWPEDPEDTLGVQTRWAGPYDPRGGSTEWMTSGACQGTDPELFFPISVSGPSVPQINSAKAICGRCIVSRNCLSYALQTMPDGIWGGTTREERIAIRLGLARSRVQPE